ncbi:MAG: tripartite tricarboxylate transporter substrate-binding protein, partial [Xanthobacteraceae bacterium]
MPADGISLPPKKDFGTSRGAARRLGYINSTTGRKGHDRFWHQADITARLIGQWLSERFGQPFIIESRPGASTNIATEAVVHAPSDGYTL